MFYLFKVQKLGFQFIDCVEPSREMIKLQPKDLYRSMYDEMICGERTTSIESGNCHDGKPFCSPERGPEIVESEGSVVRKFSSPA